MTHSIDAPFPPPVPATTGTTTESTSNKESTSKKDAAKDEARNVGQTASQAGSQVASTAADQAKEVAHETQRQAKDLLEQGRSELKNQALAQKQKAASSLSSLAQELRGLADGSSEGAPGPARDLLQQASSAVDQFADMLQNREPAELLNDVRSFARRKPGMFLLGAAAAGVLAGRLTSGVKAVHTDSGSGSGGDSYRSTPSNYVDPAPTYSDYSSATTGAGTTAGAPLPPPPYGTVPPAGGTVPPATPPVGGTVPPATSAGWDDPARRPGQVG